MKRDKQVFIPIEEMPFWTIKKNKIKFDKKILAKWLWYAGYAKETKRNKPAQAFIYLHRDFEWYNRFSIIHQIDLNHIIEFTINEISNIEDITYLFLTDVNDYLRNNFTIKDLAEYNKYFEEAREKAMAKMPTKKMVFFRPKEEEKQ